jgi:hypothetical protein
MSESFTKLFSSITRSTIWDEDNDTRIVWITLLALSDQHGYVGGSVPGLAHDARISVDGTKRALDILASPDTESRTKDHAGRRIEVVDRGWLIINYKKFRDLRDDEVRRAYERTRKRQQRNRTRSPGDVPDSPAMSRDVPPCLPQSAQAEAEAEIDLASTRTEILTERVSKVRKDQDHRASREMRSQKLPKTPDANPRLLHKLACEVIQKQPNAPLSEWVASLKDIVAGKLEYHGADIHQAITAAEHHLARRTA